MNGRKKAKNREKEVERKPRLREEKNGYGSPAKSQVTRAHNTLTTYNFITCGQWRRQDQSFMEH